MSNQMIRVNLRCLAGLTVVASLASTFAQAADLEAEFRTQYMRTDNIFLVPSNELSDSIWTVGFELRASEETARSETDVRIVADYLHFDRYYDPEWLAGMEASFVFTLIDERLEWAFDDSYGKQVVDPLASPNSGNRENVNVFGTGPTLQIPMGSRYFLDASARYSLVSFSESSEEDDSTTSGQLEFGRRANDDSTYSIIVSSKQVRLEEAASPYEYDINEVFLNYDVDSSRNLVNVEVGYTEVDAEDRTLGGTMARLEWTRIMSQSARLMLSGGTEYFTDGDLFKFIQRTGRDVGEVSSINGNGTPFRNNYVLARYNVETERTVLFFDGEYFQYDYELDPADEVGYLATLDRDVTRFGIGLRRDLTRRIFMRLGTDYRVNGFQNIDREDKDLLLDLTFGYRFSDAFNVYVSGQHMDRESTDSANSFTETRYILGFSYIPVWGRDNIERFGY